MFDPTTHRATSERSYHGGTSRSGQGKQPTNTVNRCTALVGPCDEKTSDGTRSCPYQLTEWESIMKEQLSFLNKYDGQRMNLIAGGYSRPNLLGLWKAAQ